MAGAIWSNEELDILRRVYPDHGANTCYDLLPRRNLNSIRAKVTQLGLQRNIDHYKSRNYAPSLEIKKQRYIKRTGLNINFFKSWSPEMAWVLGLLTSDGNIMDNGGIRLTLKSDDRDAVEKVRDLIAPKQEIVTDIGLSAYSRFHITMRDMVDDLANLGVTPRKSLTLKPPNIPEYCVPHYIRGLLDGDGSVLLRHDGSNKLRVAFSGNKNVTSYIVHYLNMFIGTPIKEGYTRERDGRVSVSTVEYSSHYALQVCNFIYKGSSYGTRLNRKYNTYLKHLNSLKGR